MPGLLGIARPDNITWALQHDVRYFEGPGSSLNDSGLLASNGDPKPAWNQAMRLQARGRVHRRRRQRVPAGAAALLGHGGSAELPACEFSQESGFQALGDRVSGEPAREPAVCVEGSRDRAGLELRRHPPLRGGGRETWTANHASVQHLRRIALVGPERHAERHPAQPDRSAGERCGHGSELCEHGHSRRLPRAGRLSGEPRSRITWCSAPS